MATEGPTVPVSDGASIPSQGSKAAAAVAAANAQNPSHPSFRR